MRCFDIGVGVGVGVDVDVDVAGVAGPAHALRALRPCVSRASPAHCVRASATSTPHISINTNSSMYQHATMDTTENMNACS